MRNKNIAAVMVALLLGSNAFAGAGFVVLSGSSGIWTAGTGDNPLPVGSVVQLIWTLDQVYQTPLAGTFDAAGYLAAGDYILFQGSSGDFLQNDGGSPPYSAGGGWNGDIDGGAVYNNGQVGGQDIQSGYVYLRVFNAANLASIVGGTQFGQTGFVDVNNEQSNIPPPAPQTVTFAGVNPTFSDNLTDPDRFYDNGAVLNQTVAVPEPSVFAFLGIGAAVLGLRRKLVRS